jgi:hypothetical protein
LRKFGTRKEIPETLYDSRRDDPLGAAIEQTGVRYHPGEFK